MSEFIDELFECFNEGEDINNEEKETDVKESILIANRYVAIILTSKHVNLLFVQCVWDSYYQKEK